MGELGFFGKIPSKGDFISAGLPRHFVEPWDSWNRDALAHGRQRLGDAWETRFLTSPIWRFILAPGLFGVDGWAGIIASSIDQVGRPYPLTIARPFPGVPAPTAVMTGWAAGFERMIDLAQHMQEAHADPVEAATEVRGFLDGLPMPPDQPAAAVAPFLQAGQSIQVGPVPSGKTLAVVCGPALQQAGPQCSLMWRTGWGLPAAAMVGCGLPDTRYNLSLWEMGE